MNITILIVALIVAGIAIACMRSKNQITKVVAILVFSASVTGILFLATRFPLLTLILKPHKVPNDITILIVGLVGAVIFSIGTAFVMAENEKLTIVGTLVSVIGGLIIMIDVWIAYPLGTINAARYWSSVMIMALGGGVCMYYIKYWEKGVHAFIGFLIFIVGMLMLFGS